MWPHLDLFFREGFRGREWGDTGGVCKKMNQCEKDIKLHSYEKQTKKKDWDFYGKTNVLFGEKNNMWQSDFHSVCFLAFFFFFLVSSSSLCQFFFCFFCFFSSSFKVNLKVHHRNWRVVSLLAPTGKKTGQKQSAPVPLRNKTTSKQFWVKNCLINIRLSQSSPVVFTFFRQCKVFW